MTKLILIIVLIYLVYTAAKFYLSRAKEAVSGKDNEPSKPKKELYSENEVPEESIFLADFNKYLIFRLSPEEVYDVLKKQQEIYEHIKDEEIFKHDIKIYTLKGATIVQINKISQWVFLNLIYSFNDTYSTKYDRKYESIGLASNISNLYKSRVYLNKDCGNNYDVKIIEIYRDGKVVEYDEIEETQNELTDGSRSFAEELDKYGLMLEDLNRLKDLSSIDKVLYYGID